MAGWRSRFFAQFEGERDPRLVALFRIAFFGGLALHFFPALIRLDDAYAVGALRTEEWNHWLYRHFTQVPRGLLRVAAIATMTAIAMGIVGFRPRIAAIASFAGCYLFASFNALPIQTLAIVDAWAILLLWCICGGGSGAWSVDALLRKKREPEPKLFATLALYQLLLVVFFSAVEKLLAGWPFNDEMGLLFSYPKGFIVRDWLAAAGWLHHAWITNTLSWLTVIIELGAPIGILIPRTRLVSLVVYQLFFLGIIATFEVPLLFYFMFAPGALMAFGS